MMPSKNLVKHQLTGNLSKDSQQRCYNCGIKGAHPSPLPGTKFMHWKHFPNCRWCPQKDMVKHQLTGNLSTNSQQRATGYLMIVAFCLKCCLSPTLEIYGGLLCIGFSLSAFKHFFSINSSSESHEEYLFYYLFSFLRRGKKDPCWSSSTKQYIECCLMESKTWLGNIRTLALIEWTDLSVYSYLAQDNE